MLGKDALKHTLRDDSMTKTARDAMLTLGLLQVYISCCWLPAGTSPSTLRRTNNQLRFILKPRHHKGNFDETHSRESLRRTAFHTEERTSHHAKHYVYKAHCDYLSQCSCPRHWLDCEWPSTIRLWPHPPSQSSLRTSHNVPEISNHITWKPPKQSLSGQPLILC